MRILAVVLVATIVVLLGLQFSGRIRAEERRAEEARLATDRDSLLRWHVAESTRAALEADSIRTRAAKWQAEGRARRDSMKRRVDCDLRKMQGTESMAC
jgi:hypothetical protein